MANRHRASIEARGLTMYTAAFGSMFEGSMCGAGSNVFAVWLFALSRCDREGDVELCPRPVSLLIGCSEEDVRGAIEYLTSEDPDSRSAKEGGRRLVKTGHFLYRVVNRDYYLGLMSYEKKKEADRVRQKEKYDAEKLLKQQDLANPRESSQHLAHGDGDGDGDVIEVSSSKKPSSTLRVDNEFVKNVIAFWTENDLRPKVTKVSQARRSMILARRREHKEEAVWVALRNRRDSNFLNNIYNDGRGAPIDYVMGPKNFVKVHDGNFNSAPGGSGQGGNRGKGKSEYDSVL